MAFSVTDFAAQGLPFGGARPSLFEVDISTPAGVPSISDKIRFQCRAAEIPAATVASLDVPYFGRQIKVAGNRTFADWTVTIVNDEDFQIRDAMEAWSNSINSYRSNIRSGVNNIASYRTTANVLQYGKTGNVLRQYNFVNIFPTEVSNITLDHSTDDIETFTVTFAYDYWEPVQGEVGFSYNVNITL